MPCATIPVSETTTTSQRSASLVLREKLPQIAAADFFLAFDHEMQIDREIAMFFERLLNAENVRKNLSFVVGGAARKNVTILSEPDRTAANPTGRADRAAAHRSARKS